MIIVNKHLINKFLIELNFMSFLLGGGGRRKRPEENRKASDACMEVEAVGHGVPLKGEKC